MAIENFDEVKSYFETNRDTDDVKNYVGGFMTPDRINSFLESEDGKKLIQPKLDAYATKAQKSHDEKFKKNDLPILIEEEIKKRYPEKDSKDLRIEKLEREQAQSKKDNAREKNYNKAIKLATDKNIPADLLDYFVTDDETATNDNLAKLIDAMSKHDEAIKTEVMKNHNVSPIEHHSGDNITKEQFSKMSLAEKSKLYTENKDLYEKLKNLK